MKISSILQQYDEFKEKTLTNRFFKHCDIMALLERLPPLFTIEVLGESLQGREIKAVKWGSGQTKIMLWSQMHGDEATGTMALFDLLNFLQLDNETVNQLDKSCQICIVPMVNPDGAAAFTRRNAQQIDINRDFLNTVTPEGKILRQIRDNFKPDFGFNLHDQTTLWSVTGTLKPATLSFLAPAIDQELNVDTTRLDAMLVIADIFNDVNPLLPEHIGLFDDEYEPRAFGDNFQKAGTSTILIEAGGYAADQEKQEIRKNYFASILSGLISISTKSYERQQLDNYFAIPKNNKQIFHVLIHHVNLADISVSIGMNYEEFTNASCSATRQIYSIQDIGDLSFCDAYKVYDASNCMINGTVIFDAVADFEIVSENKIILAFKNGELLQKH